MSSTVGILLEQKQLWLLGLFERPTSSLAFHDKLLACLMLPFRVASQCG